MFELYAKKAHLEVKRRALVTSGSAEAFTVSFTFSGDWDGLTKTACFKAGDTSISVLVGDDGTCILPWEVAQESGKTLHCGVYGYDGDGVVLPTIWARLGIVQRGAELGTNESDPTESVFEQWIAAVKTYSESAAASATEAAASASNAAASATEASANAEATAAYETSAATSAETALAAQGAAETAQTAAEAAATEATGYVTTAQTAAETAATAADTATTQATASATSASEGGSKRHRVREFRHGGTERTGRG